MTQRTWREGYVPGKAKKTIHLDDEVARALEIRAAEERVSQAEIVERALRRELSLLDRISVTNPWTGAWIHIEREEITAERLEAMAQLMEDDIREELHREYPDDPGEFFARYVERVGPERAGEVWCS